MTDSQLPPSDIHDSQESVKQWQRLSFISMLYFLTRNITRIIKDALPALAPLAVVIFNSDNKSTLIILSSTGLVSLIIISSFLQFWFFRYKLDQQLIKISEGVFKKKQRTINFSKIQNINIIQPIYFKLFNLKTLQIETAGSSGSEVNLAGITHEYANQIKQLILSSKHTTPENDKVSPASNIENPQVLATTSLKDILKFGLSNSNVMVFLAIMAPIWGMLNKTIDKIIGDEVLSQFTDYFGGGLYAGFIAVSLILISLFMLTFIFSILGALFKYYNFQLTYNKDTYKRFSGLLSTHEESAKKSRIQAVIRKTNYLGRWLKIENVIFKQASGQSHQTNQQQNKLFLIPARTQEQADTLQNDVFFTQASSLKFTSISRRYIIKNFITINLFLSIIILYFGTQNNPYWIGILPFVYLVSYLLILRKWSQYSFAENSDYGIFRQGFIGHNHILFPFFKVQKIHISQSPLQRRKNLANLNIVLAGKSFTIPYMPANIAYQWLDKISYKVETTHKNWF